MTLCDYQPDADGWTCSSCGDRQPKKKKRACPVKSEPVPQREPERPAYLDCPHRGAVLTTITGRVAGVGCSGAVVSVYRCEFHREPVTEYGRPPCIDSLRERLPGATGRTCQKCGGKGLEWLIMSIKHAAFELTPNLERQLQEVGQQAGAVLLSTGMTDSQYGRVVAIASHEPLNVVQAFDRSGLGILVVDGEERAESMRRLTRMPVVGHIDGLRSPNEIKMPDKFNLIYHVAPLRSNEVWRHNLDQLCQPKRWRQFNGRRIIAVATGDRLDPVSKVREEFAARNCKDAEFIEVPNDVRLREVASFKMLLGMIQSRRPNEATFYAHSKGNSTNDNAKGAWLWTLALYHHLLDQPQVVREMLRTFSAVGCTKMVWPAGSIPPYPTRLMVGHWMLAGTFFWFRNDRVFSRAGWDNVSDDRYGAEAWLSSVLLEHESVSLYQPWPVDKYPTPSPYDPAVHLEHGT